MEQQFDAVLTGTDSTIDGTAEIIAHGNYSKAYRFTSVDGTLDLVIAKDEDGEWIRIAGTEPYLSSWIDELADQVS